MAEAGRRDLIVPCKGVGHRVRLAGGVRFLARARCPKCRAAVDPTRGRRLLRLFLNLARPASDERLDTGLWWLSAAAVLLSAVTVVVFWWLADGWWPATLLLFGPRWVLLLPILPLLLLATMRDRALLLPLMVAAGVVLGPVMGFRTGWRALLTVDDPERDITVATFNARSGDSLSVTAQDLMTEWSADAAAFQECGPRLRVAIGAMEGWHTWTGGSQCLVSRFPILETRVMPADVIQRAGGSGLVVSHLLRGPEQVFWLTNVHLGTPRGGLARIRSGSLLEGARLLRRDSFLRAIEHGQARRFADAQLGAHIVVGDFNAPPESRIYRGDWSGRRNAFSVAGFGLGGTRINGWIRARIDHVVVDDSWAVVDARVGQDVGSDHLPMVATVRMR